MYIGKNNGSFQVVFIIFEIMLDHVSRSIASIIITPMFSTTPEIIIALVTLFSTIAMCVISIADLHNTYVSVVCENNRILDLSRENDDIERQITSKTK